MTPQFRMIKTNGVTLRAAVEGEGPLVVMVHGFPESWYSWRRQITPLASAGFTACAIDVRGYGGSDKPHEIEAYAMKELAADVAGVIDALSPNAPAVIIGHDWGAPIVWHTAVLYPDKVRAVAGLSVPYTGVPPAPLTLFYKAHFTDQNKFFYQVYFQDEGVAEAEFEADVRLGLRKLYFAASGDSAALWGGAQKKPGDKLLDGLNDPQPFPAWLTEADIDYLTQEFTNSGFRGPINRYRNFERDWAHMQTIKDTIVHQPALFIAGENDLVLKMFGPVDLVGRMKDTVSDLRAAHIIARIGHWTQQEASDETTGYLIDWLARL